ncbi:MAG: dihydrofolate reductase [Clostridiales bacterium]|jgi:dihydrofolate reductase|nr:dihydrofolate reductase [Clostridiales bacterium]
MNIIACVDKNFGIGYKNKLQFDIRLDKSYFKAMTINKTVIMGAKTYQSLKNVPLPNRNNIVLSTQLQECEDSLIVKSSLKQLLDYLNDNKITDVFVIGGQSVYQQLLSYCDTAYITKVDAVKKADKFMVDLDLHMDWQLIQSKQAFNEGYELSFCVYKRMK